MGKAYDAMKKKKTAGTVKNLSGIKRRYIPKK